MDIEYSDNLPDGWKYWLDWHRVIAPNNEAEIKALEADRGDYLGYVRVVGRRKEGTELGEHVVSLPAQYTKKTLLRNEKS